MMFVKKKLGLNGESSLSKKLNTFVLYFFLLQTLSLFLLSAYYKFLGGFPLVAVGALLLYVGCYQVSNPFLRFFFLICKMWLYLCVS